MVYEFAKAQGFGLSVQSEVGKGTEFFIVIPSKKIEKS
jgi:signal transduction histidine kinase